MRARAAIFALFTLGYVTLTVTSLAGPNLLFLVVLMFVLALEIYLCRPNAVRLPEFVQRTLGLSFRVIWLGMLMMIMMARSNDAAAVFGPTLMLLALYVIRALSIMLSWEIQSLTMPALQWKNLPVGNFSGGRSTGGFVGRAAIDILALSALAVVAVFVFVEDRTRWTTVLPISGFIVLLGMVLLIVLYRRVVSLRRLRSPEIVRGALRLAVEEYKPEVAIYFAGPPSSTHALNVWLSILENIDQRVLVMVREAWHLAATTEKLPVIVLPKNTDVENLAVNSIKVALYPTNVAKNNHLIRMPGIFDVFIGHGDSDKAGSANPLSRIYDEVWVAGKGGRDRYTKAGVGVAPDQIREVGRPQLAVIRQSAESSEIREPTREAPGRPLTILYAPTWEGFYDSWSYSSVVSMGPRIVNTLLSLKDVRVLYKPHPATGSMNSSFMVADQEIRTSIRQAGGDHHTVEDLQGLYSAFNDADMLISDISSVVTDFLASRKPYIVCNPHDQAPESFIRENPSTGGAYILGSDCGGLAAAVEEARGDDVRAPVRDQLTRYLLGDVLSDPTARFQQAIDDAIMMQHDRDRMRSQAPAKT